MAKQKRRPARYHVLSISLYPEDLAAMDAKVASVKTKRQDLAWVSRSAFIRAAVAAYTAAEFIRVREGRA